MKRKYLGKNVLEAARERIAFIFDTFEHIYVSVSGGKDSTALYHLALEEAIKRDRKINLFYLDQEVEYAATIDVVRTMMAHPNVVPMWYQVPIYMTNSTSYEEDMLYAWSEGAEWLRPKEDISIKSISDPYPQRFYKFFNWFEAWQPDGSAFLVGLRAEEGITRYRAVTKYPGYKGIKWTTKSSNSKSYKMYPIYDWGMGDVWKYIYDNQFSYNDIYNKIFMNGTSIYNKMRVSNLIHEKSFKCLTDLQVLEPDTFEKVIKRIKGTHCAALYAKENMIYSNGKLPNAFKKWLEYRDYLLATIPTEKRYRFVKRFADQPKDEYTFRQQCKQLLINDWENNISITKKPKNDKLERWRAIL